MIVKTLKRQEKQSFLAFSGRVFALLKVGVHKSKYTFSLDKNILHTKMYVLQSKFLVCQTPACSIIHAYYYLITFFIKGNEYVNKKSINSLAQYYIPIFGVDKISLVGLFCLIAFIRRAGGNPAPGPAPITGGTPG